MADVITFPRATRQIRWRYITLTCANEVVGYDVKAWSGLPSDPESVVMHLGWSEFHPDAYDLALEKARLVGVAEILDATYQYGP